MGVSHITAGSLSTQQLGRGEQHLDRSRCRSGVRGDLQGHAAGRSETCRYRRILFCLDYWRVESVGRRRLMNRMGLSPQTKRIPIFGLGCVAGAAGIARAADYVRAFPQQSALLLSVELCSLTIQQDDLSVANLISSGLFGDGAAAVIVSGADIQAREGPEIIATRSVFYPDTEYVMGWDISEKGFRIVLSRDVPEVVLRNLGRDADEFLSEHGLDRSDVATWVLHTGGPKVLEATETALGLPPGALQASWECLGRTGIFPPPLFCSYWRRS